MANVYRLPVQTRVGLETSIDLVRKQRYATSSVAGVKRSHDVSVVESVPSDQSTELARFGLQAPRLRASTIASATTHGLATNMEPSEYTQRRDAASTPG